MDRDTKKGQRRKRETRKIETKIPINHKIAPANAATNTITKNKFLLSIGDSGTPTHAKCADM